MNSTPRIQEQLIRPGGLSRLLRAARGDLLAKDLAERAGWQISKISKIEHGKQLPSDEDLRVWAEHTGASAASLRQWKELAAAALEARHDYAAQFRAGQRKLQHQYNEIISAATTFRLFETTFVPRFLQTRDYMRAVLTESQQRHGGLDDIDATVEARQASLVYLDDPNRTFELIITEPVLGWCFSALERDAHLQQLHRLIDLIDNPGPGNVRFGIIPLFQPIGWVPQNGFQLLGDIGFMEHWIGEQQYLLTEDLDRLNKIFDQLWASAREGAAAREIIQQAIDRLERADR
jgi:transcriptional regulator with XRE-family HTH domain